MIRLKRQGTKKMLRSLWSEGHGEGDRSEQHHHVNGELAHDREEHVRLHNNREITASGAEDEQNDSNHA
jgi:hypothetical protein